MIHHTIEKLRRLRLAGMAKALEGQLSQPDIDTLSFDERLAGHSLIVAPFAWEVTMPRPRADMRRIREVCV